MTRRSFSPEQDREVARLYNSRLSSIMIARRFGVDKSTVLGALGREGIARRTNRGLTDAEELMIARIHQVTKAAPYRIAQAYGKSIGLIHAAIKRQGRIEKDGRYSFTQGEEEQIAKIYQYGYVNAHQIARAYNVGHIAITNALKRQGITLTKRRRIKNTDGLISDYANGASLVKVAHQHQISTSTATRILSEAGIDNRPNRVHFFREDAFDNLDTEGPLYWLGFAYADSNVTHNELRFGLSIVDLSHLERIRDFMNSQATIRADHRACSVSFASTKMAQRLMELGIVVRRGHFARLAPQMPADLAHHFIRGYLDGDGCIARPHKVIFLGQPDILNWIKATLHREAGASAAVEPRKRRGIYEISWGGRNQAPKIAAYLYRDATIWLERKRVITDNWG